MIIICDVDNVLNNLAEQSIAFYNKHNGKNIQLADIVTYHCEDCLPIEDAMGIISYFKDKTLWDSLTPLPGSQNTLRHLIRQGHRIYLATATDPINFNWKIEWLQKYFPFIPSDNVIRIVDKSLLKCDVMIDDHLDNLIGNMCERIVIDAPWNRSTSKDFSYSIYRAHIWDDVLRFTNDIERKSKEWEE